jgi:DNA replication and repair protein RecF
MILDEVQIHNLRIIHHIKLHLNPGFNFFFGPNGSGKTSILEAMHLLSTGHSFRTRDTQPLVQAEKDNLVVFAKTTPGLSVSIQKSLHAPTRVIVNTQPIKSSSELATLIPCQLIYQDIFEIIDAGPTIRRNLLDWGVFHVKHDFHPLWKDYQRILKHRNSLLRRNAPKQEFIPWDNMLDCYGTQLTALRQSYFDELLPIFYDILAQISTVSCNLQYFKGWDRKCTAKSLLEILQEQFNSDLQRQYTQSGAHQADIFINQENKKAKNYVSRGQQKIILLSLKLAQAKQLGKPCLLLLDDVCAELDQNHLTRLFTVLDSIKAQAIFTGLDKSIYPVQSSDSVFNIFEGELV